MREMYKKYKIETILILSYFFIILIYNSQLNIWNGGSSFGARHFVILIPFLMLPLAYSFKKIDIKILMTFVIISIIFNFVGVQAFRDNTYTDVIIFNERFHSFQPIANPIFERYIPMFIKLGPDSRLLFSSLGIKHTPFLNVKILLVMIALIWSADIIRKIKYYYQIKIKNVKKKEKKK